MNDPIVGIVPPEQQTFVKKGWGSEQWLWNGTYCGKFLQVDKGKKCSFHYHELKNEIFFLQSGTLIIRYGWEDDILKTTVITMTKGQVFHVPTGLRHQFQALEDSLIIEFSTHHEDSDSIRVIPGD